MRLNVIKEGVACLAGYLTRKERKIKLVLEKKKKSENLPSKLEGKKYDISIIQN